MCLYLVNNTAMRVCVLARLALARKSRRGGGAQGTRAELQSIDRFWAARRAPATRLTTPPTVSAQSELSTTFTQCTAPNLVPSAQVGVTETVRWTPETGASGEDGFRRAWLRPSVRVRGGEFATDKLPGDFRIHCTKVAGYIRVFGIKLYSL